MFSFCGRIMKSLFQRASATKENDNKNVKKSQLPMALGPKKIAKVKKRKRKKNTCLDVVTIFSAYFLIRLQFTYFM